MDPEPFWEVLGDLAFSCCCVLRLELSWFWGAMAFEEIRCIAFWL